METERPAPWEELPDLALYMDQLISYMPRQLIHFGEGDALTAAMVNNYMKDGLLPRAEGKRYGRSHLAYLTAICALKSVLSVREMGTIMKSQAAAGDTERLYAFFTERLDGALDRTAGTIVVSEDPGEEELAGLACILALDSYASKLACQRVLELLRGRLPADPEKDPKKDAKKDSKKETKTKK